MSINKGSCGRQEMQLHCRQQAAPDRLDARCLYFVIIPILIVHTVGPSRMGYRLLWHVRCSGAISTLSSHGAQVRGEQTSLEDCMHLLSMKEQSITQLRQRLEDSEAMVNRLIPAKHGGAEISGPSASAQTKQTAGDFAAVSTPQGRDCQQTNSSDVGQKWVSCLSPAHNI